MLCWAVVVVESIHPTHYHPSQQKIGFMYCKVALAKKKKMIPEEEISRVKKAKGYYEVLGVSRNATEKEIKKAYRKVFIVVFF